MAVINSGLARRQTQHTLMVHTKRESLYTPLHRESRFTHLFLSLPPPLSLALPLSLSEEKISGERPGPNFLFFFFTTLNPRVD